ncbi:ankyrin repeat and zinc finger domain-containing protein 1 [Arachis ipaensis]|uniref:ankyrin repeat and zinc finger domain-containing protein 1 n=1 Tax=Arachis ipaensis TaxID=130454 RepID=UPI000A2B3AA2|nr:ankyrin repeat and zinc finger domain-containing protein 1 [Arachis ipaensis]
MASNLPTIAASTARSAATTTSFQEKHYRSVFELSPSVFDSCYFLPSTHSSIYEPNDNDRRNAGLETPSNNVVADGPQDTVVSAPRWTCNTCKAQFDSLQDQRSHFKSDIHRFNVKLTVAGKNIVKEEDFEVLTSEFVKDYDVSSISGSESDSDSENESQNRNEVRDKSREILKQNLFVGLQSGQRVSLWKCLIMNMSDENGSAENEVCERLKSLTLEPRDNSHLRIVLLASGGHFAGCVFDGDAVVAHKTFHRYVVRAKAGKKQSSKDASGRAAHSAGASLRRHNELALKKAEKEAKRKARAKELKKLKKAKEKRAQAEAALLKNDSKAAEKQMTAPASSKGQAQSKSGVKLSKEEEIRRAQAEEREKRAAAAERRIAALKIQENCSTSTHAISEPKGGLAGEIYCSCCNSSLAGKVPFHRYNYNYCSTSCMHVHREFLEDG